MIGRGSIHLTDEPKIAVPFNHPIESVMLWS